MYANSYYFVKLLLPKTGRPESFAFLSNILIYYAEF
jgi:hypothetical protein